MLKKWESVDWNAGLQETVELPNANVTKRLILELTVNLTFSLTYAPETETPPDHIFPVLERLEIETAGEERFKNVTFAHLWHRCNINRQALAWMEAMPAVADQTIEYHVMCELDWSFMQDLGLDSGQLDQNRMTLTWGGAAVLGAEVTINSGNLTIWYDERIPARTVYINPFECETHWDKTLQTTEDSRIEIPRGRRVSRLYLRLYDGSEPKPWTAANLERLTVEFDANRIWGPFNGRQANRLWHFIHGFETQGWADSIFMVDAALTDPWSTYIPFDLSYIIIDFVDPVNGQLSHAIDTAVSDQFNIVYSFDATGLDDPRMQINMDYHYNLADRLLNDGTKIASILGDEVRRGMLSAARLTAKPVGTILTPAQASGDIVAAMKAGGDFGLVAARGGAMPTGRSSPLGSASTGEAAQAYAHLLRGR